MPPRRAAVKQDSDLYRGAGRAIARAPSDGQPGPPRPRESTERPRMDTEIRHASGLRPMASHRATAPLSGRIAVPGDKSISHRALMFGALAIGETRITGLLTGEDVLRTAAAMRALGAEVTHDADGTWRVAGRGVGGLTEPADVLDMGNSGTAARLLCGILASHPIFSVMTGDASLRRRPMRRVIDPLTATAVPASPPGPAACCRWRSRARMRRCRWNTACRCPRRR